MSKDKQYDYKAQAARLQDASNKLLVARELLHQALAYDNANGVEAGEGYRDLYGDLDELMGRLDDFKDAVQSLADMQP